MVDFKAFLPGHKQTEKEGGSSSTHPLAHTSDQHNPGHSATGGEGAYPRPADGTFERDTPSQAVLGNRDAAGTAQRGHDEPLTAQGAKDRAAIHEGRDVGARSGAGYTTRDDPPLTAKGAEDRAAIHRDGTAGGVGATRGTEDIAGQEYAADRSSRITQATSGLETSDPYRAAAQAGALPDKTDIRKIDREIAAGGAGQSESTLEKVPSGLERDRGAGAGAGPGGLIHGHHTTVTGEQLDPHLAREE